MIYVTLLILGKVEKSRKIGTLHDFFVKPMVRLAMRELKMTE